MRKVDRELGRGEGEGTGYETGKKYQRKLIEYCNQLHLGEILAHTSFQVHAFLLFVRRHLQGKETRTNAPLFFETNKRVARLLNSSLLANHCLNIQQY